MEHSLFQCAKILDHFEMSYTDLYNKTEEANFARLYKYKEDTPVISYYFLKPYYFLIAMSLLNGVYKIMNLL